MQLLAWPVCLLMWQCAGAWVGQCAATCASMLWLLFCLGIHISLSRAFVDGLFSRFHYHVSGCIGYNYG